jgi:OOP family OmpA-OmpF porin
VKNTKYVIVLASAMSLLGSGGVFADAAQPWHFTAQIGGVDEDSDRDMRDVDLFRSIGFGHFFGDHFSLDLEYDQFDGKYTEFDTAVPGATYDEWKLSTTGLMGRYFFGENAWKPFVLAGLGRTRHRSILDEGSNAGWSLGAGLHRQVARHWSLNGQVMWRQDEDGHSLAPRSHFNDMFYTLGLSFDFGGKDAPPPAPPPAAAPPPPPPAAAPPPNPDLDGDGVPNERDKCPNTRPGAVVDLDGCEVEKVIPLNGVHFDFDKSTLRPEAFVILDRAVDLLRTQERVVVEVAGHTDSVGSEQYNQSLSERRADAVRDYLAGKGIKATRLSARGYGEVQPVASNDSVEGRQANRRVELIVLDR